MPTPIIRAREGGLPSNEGGVEDSIGMVRDPRRWDLRGRGEAGPCTECAANSIWAGRRFRPEEAIGAVGARRDLGAVCEDRAEYPVHGDGRSRAADLLGVVCKVHPEEVFCAELAPRAVAVGIPACENRADSKRRVGCKLHAERRRVRPERTDTHEPAVPV